jgi:hypothetical protein
MSAKEVKMQPQNNAGSSASPLVDARRKPRFKIEVAIAIHSRTQGTLKGHTVDISESGISAMLTMEPPLGELVELEFTLPFGPVTILATARQKSAFRYGFQFAESDSVHHAIRDTCRHMAVEHSLLGDL